MKDTAAVVYEEYEEEPKKTQYKRSHSQCLKYHWLLKKSPNLMIANTKVNKCKSMI